MNTVEQRPAGPGDDLAQLVAALAARVAAMPGLPADDGSRYSVRRLTVAWLLEAESVHTRTAHLRDLDVYLAWCARERLDPLTARTTDLGQFRVWRSLQEGTGGRTAAASTVARALASISSWYTHLVANNDDAVPRNPVAGAKRPKVNTHTSTTAGLTMSEVDLLLAQADAEVDDRAERLRATPAGRQAQARYLAALRDRALLWLLADVGLRISEALDRDFDDLTHNAGHRTLRFKGKGAQIRERAVPARTQRALNAYFTARAATTNTAIDALTGPMFATIGPGGEEGRLAEPNVFTWLRRLAAAAGIPGADRLSPHSLRHAFVTSARAKGVPLEDVQDAMGHADPRTTRRYDRDRFNLDRDPGYVVSAARTAPRTTEADNRPEPGQIEPMILQKDNAG